MYVVDCQLVDGHLSDDLFCRLKFVDYKVTEAQLCASEDFSEINELFVFHNLFKVFLVQYAAEVDCVVFVDAALGSIETYSHVSFLILSFLPIIEKCSLLLVYPCPCAVEHSSVVVCAEVCS